MKLKKMLAVLVTLLLLLPGTALADEAESDGENLQEFLAIMEMLGGLTGDGSGEMPEGFPGTEEEWEALKAEMAEEGESSDAAEMMQFLLILTFGSILEAGPIYTLSMISMQPMRSRGPKSSPGTALFRKVLTISWGTMRTLP